MAIDIESEFDALERDFIEHVPDAFLAARDRALAAGMSVLYTEGDSLYELHPDGRKDFVKQIPAPRFHDKSVTIRLQ